MNKANFIFLLLFIFCTIGITLSAQNHLNLITTMTGEFNGSQMGYYMTSLDFNGDGYKDLVVEAPGWNPQHYINPNNYQSNGKLYFYLGGPGFDNVPDYVIEGAFNAQLCGGIINGGDLNGDGKEDLVMNTSASFINPDSTDVVRVYIFYGSETPSTAPDVVLDFPYPHYNYIDASPLGDINNDGYDDIGFTTRDYSRSFEAVYVVLGNSFEIIPFMENHNGQSWGMVRIDGIGDVNADGVDDFHMMWGIDNTYNHRKLIVYSGSSSFPDCDSLTICENTNHYNILGACPLGDVNGDGIDDFISDMATTGRVWLGRTNLSSAWDVELTPDYFNHLGTGPAVVHTDLNNDGYEDIIGSYNDWGGGTGSACVWMGRQAFNGTYDFYINATLSYRSFGFAKAAGDFSGDGLGDVALSSPGWYETNDFSDPGRVYIYSGSSLLYDTTVGNDDEVVPSCPFWSLDIYPNPLKGNKTNLNIKFTGEGYKGLDRATFTVTNVKGQQVYQYIITHNELQAGNWSGKIKHTAPGVYIISLKQDNNILATQKILITE